MSGNHGGDLNKAIEIIQTAKQCGADAVKIQTFTPDSLTINSDSEDFKVKSGHWAGRSLYELYSQTMTPRHWHSTLFTVAEALGITLFSSPFSPEDVAFLENFNPPAYKVASNEASDYGLLKAIADTGKPVIISSGGSSKSDLVKSMSFFDPKNVAILHCIAEYPAKDLNIRTITDLSEITLYPGFSDHSIGSIGSICAASVGACIIEKHLSLDGSGADGFFSSLPDEFQMLVENVHAVWNALGQVKYAEVPPAGMFTRQFWAVKDIQAGEKITPENVRSIRAPQGMGIPASQQVYGYRAFQDIEKHQPITQASIMRAVA